ncbi:MAG TPA: hypothetical protein IAD08_07255 [Candidatus Scatovivens faecipullorum]|nr:hypothetical protein [Candidatus Scatovivens faecipullorum]
MIDLSFTNEELDALKKYINKDYLAINQMLISNCETDIALLSEYEENKSVFLSYNKENVIENLKTIKLLYKLILKQYYKETKRKEVVFRGTNLAEIDRLKNEIFIDKPLIATDNATLAENNYAANWNRPVCMNIKLSNDIPYIYVDEVLENYEKTNTIVIAPFTKIKNVSLEEEVKLEKNSKLLKKYNLEIEKQELDKLTDDERNGLYDYILSNTYSINQRLEECIRLEKENSLNFENIRKLEQLLAKYENNNEDSEIDEDSINEKDYDDIERISKELEELKNLSTNMFEIKKQNIEFVNMWKRNIAVYLIAECREIENLFVDMNLPSKETEIVKKVEDSKDKKENISQETKVLQIEEQEKQNTIDFVLSNLKNKSLNDEENIYTRVKIESLENIQAGEKLIEDIKNLITKQQNHAKIAGNMGATYSALNNAFDMKKAAEALLELLQNINLKVEAILGDGENKTNERKLEKISKVNIEISTLINYLNNPKIAVRNSKVTRFDEMAIIEENELKRRIAEKIRDIRGEAELKKLKDDLEIIEEKSAFKRIIGMITGQNKLDEFMIEQIEIRQRAIRKTLSKKLSLAYNYSIHELMAEITMFVNENEDDELVEDDVIDLKALAEELRRNYIILESKVQSIIEEKEGKNLPVDDRRISKMDAIEIETYRFLNKYGYDLDSFQTEEPKYQDTMANEIIRIIEYINSSGIL